MFRAAAAAVPQRRVSPVEEERPDRLRLPDGAGHVQRRGAVRRAGVERGLIIMMIMNNIIHIHIYTYAYIYIYI